MPASLPKSRREFISSTLGGLAAATCLPQARGQSTGSGSKKRLGVALVGLGSYAGGQLAPALELTDHCYLSGIVTGSPEKIPVWQQRYGIKDSNVYNYETMHRIADNPDIDVIYIVVPTGLHAKYSIIAANTGKHVWCEKPMAMNVQECRSIMDACNANGVRLAIGYRMQHEPNTREVISYAESHPFGPIESVRALACYAGSPPKSGWRANPEMGGGALYDMGVYSINATHYSTGLEPLRVNWARQTVPDRVDVTTEFELAFPNDITAYGKTSVVEPGNELHVDCAEGWYRLEPMQTYNGVRGRRSDGVLLDARVRSQQAIQMDDDALSILNDKPMLVPGMDGLRDIAIVKAIFESARAGSPVEIGATA